MTAEGSQRVVLVAAVADNGVIGSGGVLPWRLPEDMRHFRETTTGHVVVMGRRTFESIGRPLPRRTNIVVTRQPDWAADGVEVAHSMEEALTLARRFPGDVMVVGGAQVYQAAMRYADAQVLTLVHGSPEGDAWYPTWDPGQWQEVRREQREGFDLVWLTRRRAHNR